MHHQPEANPTLYGQYNLLNMPARVVVYLARGQYGAVHVICLLYFTCVGCYNIFLFR